MQRAAILLTALALVTGISGLAGCTGGPREPIRTYVALGDSFTSGGGLPEVPPGSPCGRSRVAYPVLVAERLRADLTNASCSGATTDNTTSTQAVDAVEIPPQLDAVRRGSDLVTVGIGYNDFGFFFDLVFGCAFAATSDPTGQPCQAQRAQAGVRDPAEIAADIGHRVRKLLEQVQERAPSAQVLLVGYPRVVPETGACPELPLAAGDYDFVRAGLQSLDGALAQAAEDADVTYVDVYAASEGHDVCAGADAWLNGSVALPGVAAAYHPVAAGQRELAALVLDALGR